MTSQKSANYAKPKYTLQQDVSKYKTMPARQRYAPGPAPANAGPTPLPFVGGTMGYQISNSIGSTQARAPSGYVGGLNTGSGNPKAMSLYRRGRM